MKVLITDFVHPKMILGLEKLGYIVDYDQSVDNGKLEEIIDDYHGVIINSKIRMDQKMIDRGTKLRFIGRLGSGLDIIDVAYAKSKKISVIRTPSGNNNAVAEHTIGMLLMLANNLRRADADVRALRWNREPNRGWELKGKTLGIIGFGHMGSQLARKLSSWELKLISYDKYRSEYPSEFDNIEKVSLDDILSRADIISLHLPLTDETFHMVDAAFFEKCKSGVVIINTSRGKVVNIKDLLSSLVSGKVAGACLDVLENEKPNTYTKSEAKIYRSLFEREDVVLSPHIAGWTKESLVNIADIMIRKVRETNKRRDKKG